MLDFLLLLCSDASNPSTVLNHASCQDLLSSNLVVLAADFICTFRLKLARWLLSSRLFLFLLELYVNFHALRWPFHKRQTGFT